MSEKTHRWLTAVGMLGPLLLLATAIAFSVTEVHSSTDTYIGLAGGRAILESTGGFPLKDTYSFTFEGHTWFNQNWLTHVWQWWLYQSFHPDGVIWGTWAMSTMILLFALGAVWLRTGSPLAAVLTAVVVAIGFRDWISARPATTQFFLVAWLWLLICALESQGQRRRWWPIVALIPLLLLWGAAHGSFLFGYTMLGLYLAYWAILAGWRRWLPGAAPWWTDPLLATITLPVCLYVIWQGGVADDVHDPRNPLYGGAIAWTCIGGLLLTAALVAAFRFDRQRGPRIDGWQAGAIAAACVLTIGLTSALGPFGLDNFLHPFTVASTSREADVWRTVGEWNPPYYFFLKNMPEVFPPVTRYWTILGCTAALMAVAAVGGGLLRLIASDKAPPADAPALSRCTITAFDVLAFAIGLLLTMFARRFAPMSLLFGAPLMACAILLLLRPLGRTGGRWVGYAGMLAAWIALPFLYGETAGIIDRTIVRPWRENPDLGLLEIVTVRHQTPHDAVQFIHNNELTPRMLAEWTHAGLVMFFAPRAQVFMDGRAQQVYTPEHYETYREVMRTGDVGPVVQAGGDCVLLHARQSRSFTVMQRVERAADQWVCVYADAMGVVYLRVGSQPLQQLRARLDAGTEWRPDIPAAQLMRGNIWEVTEPRNLPRAIADWQAAYQRDAGLLRSSVQIWRLALRMAELQGKPAVQKYLGEQRTALSRASLDAATRDAARKNIDAVLRQLDRLPPGGPPNPENAP